MLSNKFLRSLVVLDVDNGLLPLARLNLAPEQDIDLAVGTALHLRNVPPCQGKADESRAAPDVSALATKVCSLR